MRYMGRGYTCHGTLAVAMDGTVLLLESKEKNVLKSSGVKTGVYGLNIKLSVTG